MAYLGSKMASGAYQAIIALMPPHDTFIDLFAGSGAILTKKPRALRSYAVDKDPRAIADLPQLDGVTAVNSDARSFLDSFDYAGSGVTLIYADPPYLHSTRTSKARYRFEMSDDDHVDLIRQLRAVPANVILSGYPSPLYDSHLLGWHTRQFQAMTRGGPRTEKLWFNFQPGEVQWCEFAGKNFTERQRIKRKAKRWADRYVALPPAEALAVLSAILGCSIDKSDDEAGDTDDSDYARSDRPGQLFPSMVDAQLTQSRTSMGSNAKLPLPGLGVTKRSPHESAEFGGHGC